MAVDREEQRLQALVTQVRMLEAYLNEISSREELTGRALIESRASLEAVKTLTASPNSDVLFPIGSGVLLISSVSKPEKMLVDVGAGAVVEKTPEDIVTFIGQRIKELEAALQTLYAQKTQVANQMTSYRAAVSDMVEKARQGT